MLATSSHARFLSQMTSFDVVSTMHQSLMDSARHVIKRILNPRFLSEMTSCDAASTIHQILMDSARDVIANRTLAS